MSHNAEDLPVLIAQEGPLKGQRWVIEEPMLVGREPECDIMVADRQISRHHARFTPTPDGILLEDLGSKNGTHANGKRLEGAVLLQDGDVVQVALAQQFVYLSSDSTIPLEFDDFAEAYQLNRRLRLEHRSRRVWIDEQEIIPPLSVAQYTVLELLYRSAGRLASRPQIIEAVWGEEEAYDVSNQALDALVRRLRDRLATIDPKHEFIITVRGHGLRLDNPPE